MSSGVTTCVPPAMRCTATGSCPLMAGVPLPGTRVACEDTARATGCALINGSCAQRCCSPRAHVEAPSCIIGCTFSHGSFPQAAEKSVEVNVRYLDWSNAAQPFDIKPNRSCLVIRSPTDLALQYKTQLIEPFPCYHCCRNSSSRCFITLYNIARPSL